MRLLLDTHIVLWALSDVRRLGAAQDVIADGRNQVLVSAVSAFEISTKMALGKLKAPPDLADHIERADFSPLPVTAEHGWAAGELPLHHRDPFDRLLVAQARCEGLTLVTADGALAAYDVPLLTVR